MFTQIVKDPNAGIGVLKIASLSFKKAATPAALSFLINMQHGLSHNTKKAPKIGAFKSAADRNRTGTGITTHGILSPGRLPVPPRRLIYEWVEVDSNHRSIKQQIYSLSPLATRESTHVSGQVLTSYIYIISVVHLQAFFIVFVEADYLIPADLLLADSLSAVDF